MTLTDPIADMLTRVRNAIHRRHPTVEMPASRMKAAIAQVLKEEGFIRDYQVVGDGPAKTLRIELKYTDKKEPVLTGLKRVSKPGLRIYTRTSHIPRVYGGLGVAILSTPRGVMSGTKARRLRVGGEVLAYVW